MSEPKKHHIVPVFYLNNWKEEGSNKLWILDLTKNEIRNQSPEKVMHIRNYYKQQSLTGVHDPLTLEKFFGKEPELYAKRAIDNLTNRNSSLSEIEFNWFFNWIILQRIRVPRQIKLSKKMNEDRIEREAYLDPNLAKHLSTKRYKLNLSNDFKFFYMRQNLQNQGSYYCISRMKWCIFKAPKGKSFITTDSPVSYFNFRHSFPEIFLEAGLAQIGTIVFYPLSINYILELRHPESFHCPESDLNKHIDIGKFESSDINISRGEYSKNDVDLINFTLSRLADRFIVANNKNLLLFLKKEIHRQPPKS